MSSQLSSMPRQALNARQAETVERLLDAALVELDAVGHDALTIRTVAARAGVSPATAYTYLASKEHLFAELFWRMLAATDGLDELGGPDGPGTARERLQRTTRGLADVIAGAPELASAVSKALLGNHPEVERLRLRIGSVFMERFRAALGDDVDPDVLDVVTLAFTGALLEAGIGIGAYDDLADRLDRVVAVVLR